MKYKGEPEKVSKTTCSHPGVKNGPRVPLLHGSAPTAVCTRCGAWRTTLHSFGPWQTDRTVEQAAKESREDY